MTKYELEVCGDVDIGPEYECPIMDMFIPLDENNMLDENEGQTT